RLVLSQAYTDILAGNLWINNTNSSASRVALEGVLFAEGHLNVFVNSPDAGPGLGELNSNYFNFYHREATKQNPAADCSLTFMEPSMVLTSSNFYAGPVTEGSIVHSTEETERRITVYGDFMLTNTMMPSGGTIDDFSYFQNQNQFTVPHDPSRITLD
ncbi:type II secretion system protein, partial [Enterococcus faecium]|nr:type II secretion system protein [Enterococcus faecium]